MIGRGGGDRTTKGVEDGQVIDSAKRQKEQKLQKRPTEVHAGYTGRIVLLSRLNVLKLGGADGIVARSLKKTEEKTLNSRVYCHFLISQCPLETLRASLDTRIMPHSGNSWQQFVEGLFEVVQCRGAAISHIPV
jgi:hypothetical protein